MATDSQGGSHTRYAWATVTQPNVAPVITAIPDQTVSAGAAFRYDMFVATTSDKQR